MKRAAFLGSLTLILSVFVSLTVADAQTSGQKKDIDLVFIGNSITYGAQLKEPLTEAPPVIASEYLRNKPGIGEVRFSNQGRSGRTTVDYLPNPGKTFDQVIEATRKLHTDSKRLLIFSISLGTNDSAEEGPTGSPVSPDDYYKNMQSITNQLLVDFPDCKIIYQQPIWYSPNTHNAARYLAGGLARLQTYFPKLKSLVSAYGESNPGHVFMGDTKAFAYFKKHHLTDLDPEPGNAGTFYLHPNKKGAVILAEYWGEAIYRKLLKD